MQCPHLNNGECRVASQLAGRTVEPHRTACKVCLTLDPPSATNNVTVNIAIGACLQAKDQETFMRIVREHSHLLSKGDTSDRKAQSDRLRAIEAGHGVGSQIWRLLAEIGVQHDPSCDCLAWAEKLNAWGVAGCRLARAEIVEHLRSERQHYGWARSIIAAARAAAGVASDLAAGRRPWLNPLDPFGSLVDEAIRRAGEREGVSPPVAPGTDPQLPITDHV